MYEKLNPVQSVVKIRQDNDVIDCISAFYVKNETELLWPIKSSPVFDETREENDVIDYIGLV